MCVYTIKEIADIVKPIAEQYGVEKMYLFGSYARGEATEESDVDFYVEFAQRIGLRYCSFISDIEEKIGKSVDVITKNALYNPAASSSTHCLENSILSERICVYEQ